MCLVLACACINCTKMLALPTFMHCRSSAILPKKPSIFCFSFSARLWSCVQLIAHQGNFPFSGNPLLLNVTSPLYVCPPQVCDSDTVLDPACTIEMLKILEEDPMVGGVGGDVQVKSTVQRDQT